MTLFLFVFFFFLNILSLFHVYSRRVVDNVHSRPNKYLHFFVSFKCVCRLCVKKYVLFKILSIMYIETSNLIVKIRCFCLFSVCRFYGIIIVTVITIMRFDMFLKRQWHITKTEILCVGIYKNCYCYKCISSVITSYYHVVVIWMFNECFEWKCK